MDRIITVGQLVHSCESMFCGCSKELRCGQNKISKMDGACSTLQLGLCRIFRRKVWPVFEQHFKHFALCIYDIDIERLFRTWVFPLASNSDSKRSLMERRPRLGLIFKPNRVRFPLLSSPVNIRLGLPLEGGSVAGFKDGLKRKSYLYFNTRSSISTRC